MQHIVFDKNFRNSSFDNWGEQNKQTKNLLFAGTIFQDKGSRKELWDKFLKDVKSDECDYYIPLRKNGIIKKRTKEEYRWESILKESTFKELYEEVISHKNYNDPMTPLEMTSYEYEHKYALILRCVSFSDSLNFRPVLYAYKNVLPLIDYMYDPDYIQIPKHIQDQLVVKNSSDIDERIKYFNNNPSERLNIISELRKLFEIEEWINNTEVMIEREFNKIIPII